ncbi:MAG: CHAT domain-containing protein [Leptolyngbyaceae cyanobacterium RM1_1_2]|nr:CHAT domain-containing protein [Leptolyngbyaceae cyanobacterium RM1_1_2]
MAQAPSVSELEQQAQSFYQNQQYRQAIAPLQQAHQQYQQQGEATAAAVALSNLSLTYQAVGAWDEATAAVDQAIVLLHLSSSPPAPASVVAQVLDVQGKLQFDRGEVNAALATWQHTAELYQDLGDIQRLALSYINQAQALQALGLYRRVLAVLSDLQGQLADQPDSTTRVVALRALGDALRATGNLDVAAGVLSESRAIAAQLQQPELVATVNLSLGNLERSRQATLSPAEETRQDHIDQALSYYQQAANSGDRALRIQSQLNQLSLLTSPQVQRWDAAQSLYPQVQSQIGQLPPGRSAIFAQVNLAQSLIALKQGSSAATPSWQTIAQILATAQQQATDLEDPRARSFVLGNLGHLYELTQQWAIALDLTRQALALAQSINAEDISYRWQWQLGRIFKGEMTAAIATAAYPKAAQNLQAATQAYKNAFETLQNLRSDLVTANSDLRFSFRESVEPVYRQLVDLLLTPDPATLKANSAISQENLRAARDVMEALQIAELENFFQAACIESTLKIDQAVSSKDPTAAVLYPIILSDRLEVILKLPQTADLIHYTTFINKADVDSELHQLRANLERLPAIAAARRGGKRVYDWLISPVEGQLKAAKIKTLIFVLEGALRSVPMPALYDGEQYLVEKYATDLILGLEIRNPEVLPPPQQLRVLAAGLTNPPLGVGNYSPLANVNSELDKIGAAKVPATFIRDQAFTLSKFNQVLNQANYDIVHLATHGQFGADQENTFILAANGKITILELDQLFRGEQQVSDRPIQILVLSACRTAAGDDRAVLGIAGTAVRASARSAIASLWSLDDESSVLFAETLYQNLGQPGVSRAEALRRAQVALLQEYRFPLFWAPYVLVGSWL